MGTTDIKFELDPILDLIAAVSLKQQIVEALHTATSLELDAANVEQIATPCVQILDAAARASDKAHISFRFTNVTPAFQAALKDLGAETLLSRQGSFE